MAKQNDEKWNEMFELYKEYVNTYYKFPIANSTYKGENLGQWFRNQFTAYENNNLLKERISALDEFNPIWKEKSVIRKEEEKRLLIQSDWKEQLSDSDIPIDEIFNGEQLYTCILNGIYSCLDYMYYFENNFVYSFFDFPAAKQKKFNNIFSFENRNSVYDKMFPNLNFYVLNIIANVYKDSLNPYVEYKDFSCIDLSEMYNKVCPSSKMLKENADLVLETLTPKEKAYLQYKYRDNMTLTDIAKKEVYSRERVRQVIAKAERKLRHPQRAKMLNVFMFSEPVQITTKKLYDFSEPIFYPEVIKALINAEIYTPKQLFETPLEQIKAVMDDKDYILLLANLETIKYREEKYKEMLLENPEKGSSSNDALKFTIEDLNLSIRSFNCLKRAGIIYIKDLIYMTEEDLMKIKNLSRKGFEEIIEKMHSLGYDNFPAKEEIVPEDKLAVTANYRPDNYTFKTSFKNLVEDAENRNSKTKSNIKIQNKENSERM